LPGRCTRCKSSTIEIDYIIQQQGISIFSPRLKGGERFIAFDKEMEFNERGFLRMRARNKVLNLPLLRPELERVKQTDLPPPPPMDTVVEEPTDIPQ
jgi:hypothetical protein